MMYLVWYLVAGLVSIIAFTIGVGVRAHKRGYDVSDYYIEYTEAIAFWSTDRWWSLVYIALWTIPTLMLAWPMRLLVCWRKIAKVDMLYEFYHMDEEEEL